MTVDDGLHAEGDALDLRFGSDPDQAKQVVVEARNGCAVRRVAAARRRRRLPVR